MFWWWKYFQNCLRMVSNGHSSLLSRSFLPGVDSLRENLSSWCNLNIVCVFSAICGRREQSPPTQCWWRLGYATISPPLFPIPFSHSRLLSVLTWLDLFSFHLTTKFPFLNSSKTSFCNWFISEIYSDPHLAKFRWTYLKNMATCGGNRLCKYRSHIPSLWARVNSRRIGTISM